MQFFYKVGALVLWVGFISFTFYQSPPWEYDLKDWARIAAGTMVVTMIYVFGNKLDKFARRRGIGEARFDSKTGKLIKDE